MSRFARRLASLLATALTVSTVSGAPAAGAPARASKGSVGDAAVGFRGGPDAAGVLPGRVPQRRPHPIWTVKTDGPIRSTPLWVGDRIFFGSADGRLYAIEARTGNVLWRAATGGAVDGSPAWAGGFVVVASRDRVLRAHDPATGAEKWRFAFGEDIPFKWGWDFFLSSAAVAGNAVIVGGGDGRVYALDARTGRERWRFATAQRVRSTAVIDGGIAYIGSFDGHVYGLDVASGREVWRFDTEGLTFDSEKFGFDRLSIQSSPTVAGDAIVVGSRDGHFYAAERSTGKQRWSQTHRGSWVVGSAAFRDGIAYVGSSDGHFVQAVEVASGKEVWRIPVPLNVLASPIIVGDTLLFGCMDGALLAVEIKTGREMWRYHAGETLLASPVAKDGVILVASLDGVLTALSGDPGAAAVHADRAVYADPDAPWRWQKRDRDLREELVGEGYTPLDAAGLVKFLETHTRDRAPSVVVVASGIVPPGVEGEGNESAPIRRYLEAGGKVVWVGGPPFAFLFDEKTRMPTKVDGSRTERILGVSMKEAELGLQKVTPTKLGEKLGLSGWWVSDIAIHPVPGIEVLAQDENGLPSMWRKRFGGPEGTGFIYLWGREWRSPPTALVLAAAEDGLP